MINPSPNDYRQYWERFDYSAESTHFTNTSEAEATIILNALASGARLRIRILLMNDLPAFFDEEFLLNLCRFSHQGGILELISSDALVDKIMSIAKFANRVLRKDFEAIKQTTARSNLITVDFKHHFMQSLPQNVGAINDRDACSKLDHLISGIFSNDDQERNAT